MSEASQTSALSLTPIQKTILLVSSFMIVAIGQPAWSLGLSLVSYLCGFALFWRVLLAYPNWRHRFVLGILWYAAVTLVHLSWSFSHPYFYIYGVMAAFALLAGLQFGLLSILITPERLSKKRFLIVGAAIWTILEWSRLGFMSGYTWNPAGLTLTGNLFSLQMASLWGIYGLTFWVTFVNLFTLRTWIYGGGWTPRLTLAAMVLMPFIYGAVHIGVWDRSTEGEQAPMELASLLVQPHFPVENQGAFSTPQKAVSYVLWQWTRVLELIQPYHGQTLDLIVLPEYVVPFGTYWTIFPFEQVKQLFTAVLGADIANTLPEPSNPDAQLFDTPQGKQWFVSNAYLAQAVAQIFNAGVVVGLQDEDEDSDGIMHSYSAAFHFCPHTGCRTRYEKQVLIPMGEYIPFSFVRSLAARYGIHASFTPGVGSKSFCCSKARFGISICYEETCGNLMRANRTQGAELLVNVTNDGWFPNSRLSQQHFDHARVRTVELGIPMVRSANTGVTGAMDSLGRVIAILEGPNGEPLIDGAGAIKINVPIAPYPTLYASLGDGLIISLAAIAILMSYGLLSPSRRI